MTTQNFIDENNTATFKKGDKVVMHGCYEATFDEYKGKVWTCSTNSYLDKANQEVVFLDGFSGCFAVQFLKPVNNPSIVSRPAFMIDKDAFRERVFRMIMRIWQKEYDTKYIKILMAAKTLIDGEIDRINKIRVQQGKPCG